MFTLFDLAEQEERQEGHERLVEMEQVESFVVEHPADLAEVARREGERPDGRVDRHGEADAKPDDVALGRALRSMAGGQDAYVVTPQTQVLVQEPDVLGDAAVVRVDVRTDEPDLHGRSALGS
ncbi:MAG: hypothetical protein WKF78_09170 [Candidatus Limnocylindrales bacterium]